MPTTYTLTEQRKPSVHGDQKVTHWILDVTDYWQSNQVNVSASELKLQRIERIEVESDEADDRRPIWDGTTDTPSIRLIKGSTGAEVADGTDAGEFQLVAYGR